MLLIKKSLHFRTCWQNKIVTKNTVGPLRKYRTKTIRNLHDENECWENEKKETELIQELNMNYHQVFFIVLSYYDNISET